MSYGYGYDNNIPTLINKSLLEDEQLKKVDKLKKEYNNKPDRYLYREIVKLRDNMDLELRKQHYNNLVQLEKMEGFVDDNIRRKINRLKGLLEVNEKSSNSKAESDGNYFSESSLLLWHLSTTFLFRK
ncbi:hypothetical protein [Dethiothermospora halolimnae]|uniref:hypothetical protein n=1 Tax=Dethiothermospora halolimnae TaxID=3114390 RepID=UPI003CCBEC7C